MGEREKQREARGVATLALLLVVLLGPAVPPSYPKAELTAVGYLLVASVVPLLGLGVLAGLVALGASWSGSTGIVRLFTTAAMSCLSLAGLFAGGFGVDTIGGAVLLPSMLLVAYVWWRL
jgi:hypothetical protein